MIFYLGFIQCDFCEKRVEIDAPGSDRLRIAARKLGWVSVFIEPDIYGDYCPDCKESL